MLYKTDYHVHTSFSDGKAPADEYLSYAIAAGVKEIGFSEHLNLFSENQEWCMDISFTPDYISHLKIMRKNTGTIKIKIGLEVDFFPGKEKETYEFINRLDLDFVIGSVHYLGERTVDSGPDFYEGRDIDNLYESYFDRVREAIASGLFDIIAHCDLIRIYNFRPVKNPEPLYLALAKEMKIHDVAFEVNTNGKNRPLGDFYPDRKFLDIFRKENVPVCVNSDAHMPMRVGQYFDEAYQLLKDTGFKEMAVFDKRERFLMKTDFKM